jgi:hypothetical protein
MQVTPKTEKEAQEAGLFPAGKYPFEVVDAKEKVSTKGNEMIELKLAIYDAAGNARYVFDYLMESFPLKLRHAAIVCGLEAAYDGGILNADDFKGKTGIAKVFIKTDKNGQYADNNAIADYFEADGEAAATPQKPSGKTPNDLDDEIPF